MARNGASQTKVANAMGISPATLSYFIKGTYTGDIDAICDKVKDFLEIEAQRDTQLHFRGSANQRIIHLVPEEDDYIPGTVPLIPLR